MAIRARQSISKRVVRVSAGILSIVLTFPTVALAAEDSILLMP